MGIRRGAGFVEGAMRRSLPLVAAALAAVAAVPAIEASPQASEGAGTFIVRIVREELQGRWSRQWTELHPGHQRLITRREYVACSKALSVPVATGREVFRIVSVADEPIHVRGVPQRTAKVVTLRLRQSDEPAAQSATYRLHAVRVHGRWRWILAGRFLDAVAHGRCLDGSPLSGTGA